jgi:hypothetical protein
MRMTRGTLRRAGADSLHARAEPLRPELRFRALAPREALVELAREQDALLRGVIEVDGAASKVAIERLAADGAARYHVLVRSAVRGAPRCGSFEHSDASIALRTAYTELLRNALQAVECSAETSWSLSA